MTTPPLLLQDLITQLKANHFEVKSTVEKIGTNDLKVLFIYLALTKSTEAQLSDLTKNNSHLYSILKSKNSIFSIPIKCLADGICKLWDSQSAQPISMTINTVSYDQGELSEETALLTTRSQKSRSNVKEKYITDSVLKMLADNFAFQFNCKTLFDAIRHDLNFARSNLEKLIHDIPPLLEEKGTEDHSENPLESKGVNELNSFNPFISHQEAHYKKNKIFNIHQLLDVFKKYHIKLTDANPSEINVKDINYFYRNINIYFVTNLVELESSLNLKEKCDVENLASDSLSRVIDVISRKLNLPHLKINPSNSPLQYHQNKTISTYYQTLQSYNSLLRYILSINKLIEKVDLFNKK